MSNTKNTGGAAFPDPAAERKYADCEGYEHGMTLRDYFAAKAMVAVILCENKAHREGYRFDGWQSLAEDCYNWADAMLKARDELSEGTVCP